MKRLLLVSAMAIAGAVPAAAATKSDGGTKWSVTVVDAAPLTQDMKAYRIFGTPDSITLGLTIANDSREPLVIRPSSLRDRVQFALQRDQPIPVIASWSREGQQAQNQAEPAADEDVLIGSGKSMTWTIVLARATRQTFARGRYVLGIAMSGQSLPPITLNLDVRPPVNARESAAALRLQAERVQDESPDEALTLLHLALATDPAGAENSVALGDSYVQAERYDEAIPFFERALQLVAHGKESIHERIALAYVGAGDEAAAARALRAARVSESSIKHNLERHRQTVASLVDGRGRVGARTSSNHAHAEIQ